VTLHILASERAFSKSPDAMMSWIEIAPGKPETYILLADRYALMREAYISALIGQLRVDKA
jgi:hypothetical protein